MLDVTDIFQQYRLSLRELWNRCFWADVALRHWNSVDHFALLEPMLFKALVLEKLDLKDCCVPDDVKPENSRFYIVPNVPGPNGSKSAVLTLLSGKSEGGWDAERRLQLKASDVTLRFRDFFDWSHLDYRDIRYYRVDIVASEISELVGRGALVDVYEADVMFDLDGGARKVNDPEPKKL